MTPVMDGAMAVPEDSGRVLTAIRLGWYLAEVRGRNRPDAPPGPKAGLPGPPSHALPLRIEQSATELRIEAQAVVIAMADELRVDKGNDQPSYARAIDLQAGMLARARESAALAGQVPVAAVAGAAVAGAGGAGADGAAVAAGPPAPSAVADDPAAQWDALQELIFRFDEHIQNTLVSGADAVACGYQLGRALAEPYWALDPNLPKDAENPAAWDFLLGRERCDEMSRLVGRLSEYCHPYTAAAIAGSVQVWNHVAGDEEWRAKAYYALYLQVRRWYELVVMGQDPTTLVQPYALTRNFRMIKRALRIFWPELVTVVIAAAALSGFAVAIGEKNINSFLKSSLGFIAIAGLSIAGLTARLKNQAQAMVTRLRQDVYTDLVAVAITTAPLPPAPPSKPGILEKPRKAIAESRQKKAMIHIIRERSLTPVTPN
jgi:hypothetical protein